MVLYFREIGDLDVLLGAIHLRDLALVLQVVAEPAAQGDGSS